MHGTDLAFEPIIRTYHDVITEAGNRKRVYRSRPSRQRQFHRALAGQAGGRR